MTQINYGDPDDGNGNPSDSPTGGNVVYTLDGFGRTLMVTDNRTGADNIGGSGAFENKIEYDYDPLNRMIAKTDQDGYKIEYGVRDEGKIRYGYRGDNQKLAIRAYAPGDPDTLIYQANYYHNPSGRLVNVRENSGEDKVVALFEYDDNGNRDIMAYDLPGNGGGSGSRVTVDYGYNRDNYLNFLEAVSTISVSFRQACVI